MSAALTAVGPTALGCPRPLPRGPSASSPASGRRTGRQRLDDHLDPMGRLPDWPDSLSSTNSSAVGCAGQGGAWFPVATKWRALRRTRLKGPVVVANGAEGEPASGKDRLLAAPLPHLVLDGAAVAARTRGASQVFVHVHADAVAACARPSPSGSRHGIDPVAVRGGGGTRPLPGRPGVGRGQHRQRTKPATPYFASIRRCGNRGWAVGPRWSRTSSRWPMWL